MRRTALNIAMQSSMACIHKRFNEEAKDLIKSYDGIDNYIIKEDKIVEAHEIVNKVFKEVLG